MKSDRINHIYIFVKTVILFLIFLFFSLNNIVPTEADEIASGTFGIDLTWVLDSDGTLTISGEGEMIFFNTTLAPWNNYYRDSIISVVIEPGITSIEERAFQNCKNLISVSVPESVTKIDAQAFSGCVALTDINIPEGVTSIGEAAFQECSGLTDIVIPDSMAHMGAHAFEACTGLTAINIPTNMTSIYPSLFYGCTGLTTINIPDSITVIGHAAFSGCTGLTSITIPDSVTEIDFAVFYECAGLTSITIPDSVTRIGSSAFQGCSSLETVTLSKNLELIEWWLFDGCSSLTELVIPDGVSEIGVCAFSRCTSLTNITLPDSVTYIGDSVFSGCSQLTGITLPDNVTYIGSNAFFECSRLTSITIPASVSSIGNSVLAGCNSLESVFVAPGNTIYDSRDNCNAIIESETNTIIAGCNKTIIPDSVTGIGESAFLSCSGLVGITIPDSVGIIGNNAFEECTGLTDIIFSSSLSSIGDYAFSECSGLTSVTIPESVTYIGKCAFSGCAGLISVTIPPGMTTIGSAFSGCTGLTTITLPDSMTDIGANAFSDCTGLTSIVIPDSVTSIGMNAFSGCTGLTNITIPNSVTNIGRSAFSWCTGLTGITIPASVISIENFAFSSCCNLEWIVVEPNNPVYDSRDNCNAIIETETNTLLAGCINTIIPNTVTNIGTGAFFWCTKLKDIVIPDSVIYISDYAFSGCTGLTSMIIPNSVSGIGRDAFSCCSSLMGIMIPQGVAEISQNAFQFCDNLRTVSIPESVQTIGKQAFSYCTNLTDVFFNGTEEEWNILSREAGFGDIHLFSQEDYDTDLNPVIQVENVPGGKAVTIEPARGPVFYTLDGTHPGTASIPYEGTFLLDEAGDYVISAITIDNSTGTYGYAETDSFQLEQSGLPQIHEENGWIHITPEEDVYYSMDLMEEPSAASSKYKEPLLLSDAMTIRARIIENGKAPGQTVSYYYFVSESWFQYPADSYRFSNIASSFGYPTLGYKISKDRYTEIFGMAAGEFLYDIYGGTLWAGSCYGMATTSLMFSKGILDLGTYSDAAQSVYELLSPSDVLIRLIERYQVAQFLPEMVKERDDKSSGGTMVISGLSSAEEAEALLGAVQTSLTAGNPVVLILWRNDLEGSHAVVPYRMENGKIYIYDCNDPGGQHVITYQRNNNGTYSFSYGRYSYAISINTLTTLLQRLEGLQTGQVSLTADGKEQMLVSLNTNSFRIMDPYGNEITDYTVCRTTEDMQGAKTVLYLERGDYIFVNTDMSASPLQISVSTEEEYYTVTVDDSQALIGIGTEYGHLYIAVNADDAAQIHVQTLNTSGRENDIGITADYAKIYACTELAVLVETTAQVMTANGETRELTENPDNPGMYYGSAAQRYIETARPGYNDVTDCRLSTEPKELSGETFSLGVQVSGAEDAVIYVATYDTEGRMLEIRSRQTEAGKTRYPFTVSGEAARVQVFLVDQETGVPLTGSLTIQ